ncbi:hypothetical protein AWC38_SpisGene13797 [Stylophora pistillata]|uniref:Uncharacterized protein n=1 Tax=Stylophora pistillata TaxID=50429 RepID=A0A2B4RZP6_STYPI|nr:hypothetical protein AWC38_SpisGene13797 [Stylophora pistillata]
MGTIKVSKKEREGGNLQSQNINSEVYHLRWVTKKCYHLQAGEKYIVCQQRLSCYKAKYNNLIGDTWSYPAHQ